ncbi:zinc transporter ZupT [Geoalkalibacter halelectricus]|uniref:Zinc transporter ZupT n=1 Tax=Geoalkalibacter halelectricus TaxID=2847045 RepID=A0ABY5ZI24_9BACT|nr:zinc transporter ZupT [Geoalkalibacter halelectricus]MDO3378981.1 zinc transporter ZupT [Geoalkalibacter halelectricus]UWZ78797.1 zinc transporter ZupT [Geoalkalibacter halelectricus]
MPENFWFAFGLTLIAGLSTGIGSAIAFFSRHTNTRFLSIALGFSAGVMVYISLAEILVEAQDGLVAEWGGTPGAWAAVAAFFTGILVIAVIDRLVPERENPHEVHLVEETLERPNDRRLMRMGVMAALAIGIHNFPEGLATFFVALHDPALGIPIALAIALHNIPEGIAVSIPIYYATGSRRKAFFYSFLSGLAEPIGALVGFFLLMPFYSETLTFLLLAGVAGIMVFISLDELLPAAREYGEHHLAIYGLIGGMMVMAASLVLLM